MKKLSLVMLSLVMGAQQLHCADAGTPLLRQGFEGQATPTATPVASMALVPTAPATLAAGELRQNHLSVFAQQKGALLSKLLASNSNPILDGKRAVIDNVLNAIPPLVTALERNPATRPMAEQCDILGRHLEPVLSSYLALTQGVVDHHDTLAAMPEAQNFVMAFTIARAIRTDEQNSLLQALMKAQQEGAFGVPSRDEGCKDNRPAAPQVDLTTLNQQIAALQASFAKLQASSGQAQ